MDTCSVCGRNIGKGWAFIAICGWLTPPKREVVCAKCHNAFYPVFDTHCSIPT